MRKVLASLKPYYYYLVGEGIKKIEVRKDMPKASDWNKEVFFYMSKDVKSFAKIPKEFQEKYRKHFGKIGLKFICDRIEEFYCASVPYQRENNLGYGQFIDNGVYKVNGWHEGIVFERNDRYIDTMLNNNDLKEMRLTAQELFDYIGVGKHLYGWRISDLKIYDRPRELSEFKKTKERIARTCGMQARNGLCCAIDHEELCDNVNCCFKRPCPSQSWCYVEELTND